MCRIKQKLLSPYFCTKRVFLQPFIRIPFLFLIGGCVRHIRKAFDKVYWNTLGLHLK